MKASYNVPVRNKIVSQSKFVIVFSRSDRDLKAWRFISNTDGTDFNG